MCVHSLDSADDLLVSAGLHKCVRIWEPLHDVRHGLNHVQKEDRDDEHVCMHTDHPESWAEICDSRTQISEEQKACVRNGNPGLASRIPGSLPT